jgi:DAK2 domain fusion protein YloV
MLAMTSAVSVSSDPVVRWDGEFLRRCLAGAVQLLGRRSETINNLNVFPVPDGDTGTNMLLTMRSALVGVEGLDSHHAGSVAATVARGALLGARGNSGVILSQYLRGFARGLDGCEELSAQWICRAFQEASLSARAAVSKPIEGTMLTLAADVARVVSTQHGDSADLLDVLESAVAEAEASLARTREIMPILRQANVVDSGAFGLATILEGMTLAARGDELPFEEIQPMPAPAALRLEPDAYGYCTEFLVRGQSLDFAMIRDRLISVGDSLLVVGDEELVRVHLHTFQPGQAIDTALGFGGIEQVKIENMQLQNERIRAGDTDHHTVARACALVAVSVGVGFADLFRSFGATIVPGGQTLNPSAEEILQELRRVAAKDYVLIPNNPNVLLTAQQAATLWGRPLVVVPTRNLAEGVAAAFAFQPNRSAADNAVAMNRGLASVRTGLVTVAVRAAGVGDREIAAGAILGLVDDQIEVIGENRVDVALRLLTILGASQCEVITLYAGEGVTDYDAANLRSRVQETFPDSQADLVPGGQPHHWFILACE